MADLPHFSLPLRFAGGAAVVDEQDSTDEILSCNLAVLLCPVGFRVELPAFGIADPTFTEGVANANAIEAALAEWEPRSHELAVAAPDLTDLLVSHVLVRVGTPSED